MLEYIPEDTLSKWSGCQRTRVSPSSVEGTKLHEFSEIQFRLLWTESILGLFKHLPQIPVVVVSCSMKTEWEIIWYSLEEETQNTMGESGQSFGSWFKLVNNMHLKVHELSIDGVLSWSVEMVLKTVEIAAFNVICKQANG